MDSGLAASRRPGMTTADNARYAHRASTSSLSSRARRSVPDVLASTANLLKIAGWQPGQPFGEGTPNFEAMREWNRALVYRKTMHLFAERLAGR